MDVILNPNPGNPLCWSALSIERDDAEDAILMRRGTVSVSPAWLPVNTCRGTGGRVAWTPPLRQSLSGLRRTARRDCWTRAWLQFGRAPVIDDNHIADFRFGSTGNGNFTAMPIRADSGDRACPRHLTNWSWPRADIVPSAIDPR
jgi:inner membrane protein